MISRKYLDYLYARVYEYKSGLSYARQNVAMHKAALINPKNKKSTESVKKLIAEWEGRVELWEDRLLHAEVALSKYLEHHATMKE